MYKLSDANTYFCDVPADLARDTNIFKQWTSRKQTQHGPTHTHTHAWTRVYHRQARRHAGHSFLASSVILHSRIVCIGIDIM